MDLRTFVAADPHGLYRGKAHLLLAEALMQDWRLDEAKTWTVKLEKWVQEARKDKAKWAFDALLPGICAAAGDLVKGPPVEWTQDKFGYVHRLPLRAGQMNHERSAPWILNDLEDWSARYAGFFLFLDRKYEPALAQWKRILKLDPDCREGDIMRDPNPYTRLKWAAENHRMLAKPYEADLFSANTRLHRMILLGEFWYGCDRYGDGEAVFRKALSAAKELRLGEAQTDYLHAKLSRMRIMQSDRPGGIAELEKILEHVTWTETEINAAHSYSTLMQSGGSKEAYAKGIQAQEQLARLNSRARMVQMARMEMAIRLWREGKKKESGQIIGLIPKDIPDYYAIGQKIRETGTW